jgi:hypothetical protein
MPDRELNIPEEILIHNDQQISPEEYAQIEQYERNKEEELFYLHEKENDGTGTKI